MASSEAGDATVTGKDDGHAPERAGLVLITLIMVAAVANLNLAVANVALPDIGHRFGASASDLAWVVDGYTVALTSLLIGASLTGSAPSARPRSGQDYSIMDRQSGRHLRPRHCKRTRSPSEDFR